MGSENSVNLYIEINAFSSIFLGLLKCTGITYVSSFQQSMCHAKRFLKKLLR